jgi:hypothetical protein
MMTEPRGKAVGETGMKEKEGIQSYRRGNFLWRAPRTVKLRQISQKTVLSSRTGSTFDAEKVFKKVVSGTKMPTKIHHPVTSLSSSSSLLISHKLYVLDLIRVHFPICPL